MSITAPAAIPAPEKQSSRHSDTDFGPMVRAAVQATSLAVIAKIGSSLWFAHRDGATVEVRWFHNLVPYFAFLIERSPFIILAASSTLVMAVLATVTFAASLIRSRRNQFIAGWLAGPLALINTLFVDFFRHLVDPPFFRWQIARWSLLCVVVCLILTAAWLLINRPWASDSADHSAAELDRPDPATALGLR